MTDEDLKRLRDDTRRYWFHNLTRIPDLGPLVTEYLGASSSGKWAIALLVVALIMVVPVIGIIVALF